MLDSLREDSNHKAQRPRQGHFEELHYSPSRHVSRSINRGSGRYSTSSANVDLEKNAHDTEDGHRKQERKENLDRVHSGKSHGSEQMTPETKRASRKLRAKNHILAFIGELVGTTLFMFFALGGTNVANIPATTVTGSTTSSSTSGDAVTVLNTSSLLYIALSFGFSLAVCAWIFFRVSGGLFNPAISLALWLAGVITWHRAALLTIAQCIGAILGAALVLGLLPGDLYSVARLGSGTSIVQGVFLEAICTFLLMLAVLFLAAEKSKATFLAPIGIGLALFVAELVSVLYTGGALNPARALGPDTVVGQFPGYHWIYWVGPAFGATCATGFYKGIKAMHFETVVPDQDGDGQQRALAKSAESGGLGGGAAPSHGDMSA